MKKYKVTLTADERQFLHDLIAAGKASALKLAHARILLKADAAPNGPAWTDVRIAEAVEVNRTTVAILLLSLASPALYAVALGQALRLPTAEVGLPAKAHLSAVTSTGAGLAALAARCGWVGLRTWSW